MTEKKVTNNTKEVQQGAEKKSDSFAIVLLLILYVIQGIPFGFYFVTIPYVLIEKGASVSSLTIMTVCYAPLCFKFLLTPLLNSVREIVHLYYIKSFGKGKTYLVPALYLFGYTCFSASQDIYQYIDELNLTALNILSWAAMGIMAITDVVIDGWIIKLLKPENVSSGAICQTIGQNIGQILANNILVPLSSVAFCNTYIYSTPQKEALIPFDTFLRLTGVFVSAFGAALHLFMKEPEETETKSASIGEILSMMKKFVTHSKMRNLMILFCSWNVFLCPILNLFTAMAIKNGYPKENITNIFTIQTPLIYITCYLVGKFCKSFNEVKLSLIQWVIRVAGAVMVYFFLTNFGSFDSSSKNILMFVGLLISQLTMNGLMVSLNSFGARVGKETYGAPFLTALSSFVMFARLLADGISYGFADQFEWIDFAHMGLGSTAVYALWFIPIALILSKTASSEFMDKQKVKSE